MKKILSLLTVVALSATSLSTVVSCSSISSGPTKESKIQPGNNIDLISALRKIEGKNFEFNASAIKDTYADITAPTIVRAGTQNEYTYKSVVLTNYLKQIILKAADPKINITDSLLKSVNINTTNSGVEPAVQLGQKQLLTLYFKDSSGKEIKFGFSFIIDKNADLKFEDIQTKLKNQNFDLNNFNFAKNINDFDMFSKTSSPTKTIDAAIANEVNEDVAFQAINNNLIYFDQYNQFNQMMIKAFQDHQWHVGYNDVLIKNPSNVKDTFTVKVYAHWSKDAFINLLDDGNKKAEFWKSSDLILNNNVMGSKINSDTALKAIQNELATQKWSDHIFGDWTDKGNPIMNSYDAKRIISNKTDRQGNNTFDAKVDNATLYSDKLQVQTFFSKTKTNADINVHFKSHVAMTVDDIANLLISKKPEITLSSTFDTKNASDAIGVVKDYFLNNNIINKREINYLYLSDAVTQKLVGNKVNKVTLTISNEGVKKDVPLLLNVPESAAQYAKALSGISDINIKVKGLDSIDASSQWQYNTASEYKTEILSAITTYAKKLNISSNIIDTIALSGIYKINDFWKNGINYVNMQLSCDGQVANFNVRVNFTDGKANHSGMATRQDPDDQYYLFVDISHYACEKLKGMNNVGFYNYLFNSSGLVAPYSNRAETWRKGLSGSLDNDVQDWFNNTLDKDNQYVGGGYVAPQEGYIRKACLQALSAYNNTGSLRITIFARWYTSHNKVGVRAEIVDPTWPYL